MGPGLGLLHNKVGALVAKNTEKAFCFSAVTECFLSIVFIAKTILQESQNLEIRESLSNERFTLG